MGVAVYNMFSSCCVVPLILFIVLLFDMSVSCYLLRVAHWLTAVSVRSNNRAYMYMHM